MIFKFVIIELDLILTSRVVDDLESLNVGVCRVKDLKTQAST